MADNIPAKVISRDYDVKGQIQMNQNPILGMILEVLTAAPSVSLESRVYYDSVNQTIGVKTQSGWKYLGIGDMLKATYDSDSDGVLNVSAIPKLNLLSAAADINISGYGITGARDAIADTDLVTLKQLKAFKDKNDVKDSVRCAYTANITLTGTPVATDGITPSNGDRILATAQTSSSQNGIYIVNTSGVWARATDADSWDELISASVAVEEGTVYKDSVWMCTVDRGGTLGSTAVNWTCMPGLNQLVVQTGSALKKVGNALSVEIDGVTVGVNASNQLYLMDSSKYVKTYYLGAPTAAAARTLINFSNPSGKEVGDFIFIDATTLEQVEAYGKVNSTSALSVAFTQNITTGQYKIYFRA